jgi:LPS-assembly protein
MLRSLATLLLVCLATALHAQEPATLIADRVDILADQVLVAEGSVEVLHKGVRLRAQRVTFDTKTDRLLIEGPLILTDAEGTRLLADEADLTSDLRDGLLSGARLVLDQQLQLAATEMQRVGGRYTELGRTVASSCKVCAANPVPLWEIRARRVLHDQQQRQLYFSDAQLRVAGIPVFYVPRLRMPDPTLKRATGFLQPKLRSTSELGTGFSFPYFIALGDSRDLTLIPYIATKDAQTLGFRYRQAFNTGRIELEGAVSSDQILPGETRGYLFASGGFALPRDFNLGFGLQLASDNGYLLDYGISSQDVLVSFIAADRVRRDQYTLGRIINFQSLRDDDDGDTVPSTQFDAGGVQRFQPDLIGGIATFRYQLSGETRTSNSTTDSDADGISDGLDSSRALLRMDWRKNWVLPGGVVGTMIALGQADVTFVQQDPTYPSTIERLYGAVGTELRWPLVRAGRNGATQILEPVLQLVVAPDDSPQVPNEDSQLVDFDTGNLFSINRFPGTDAVELGSRATLGLNWTHLGTDGSTLGLAFGRIYRVEDLDQFDISTGLDGARSDWLIGARVVTPAGLSLTQRVLLDDDLSSTEAESRFGWFSEDLSISSGYYWNIADPDAGQTDQISEWSVDGSWRMAENWTGRLGLRQDFIAGRASRANVGLEYRNECILVDLSLSRWFADSTSLTPTTEFGVSVDLLGFGGSAAPGPTRRCRG